MAAPRHSRPPARGQARLKPLTDEIFFFCQATDTHIARHTSPWTHSRAPGVKDFAGGRQNASGDVWRRALTKVPPFAGFSRHGKQRQEEAASIGPGAQKCSVPPSSTQSPALGHSCPALLTQPSKLSPASTQERCAPSLKPPAPGAGGLWGFLLPFLIPGFDGFTAKPSCPQGLPQQGRAGVLPVFNHRSKGFPVPSSRL